MPVKKDVIIAMPAYDNKTEFDIYAAIQQAIHDPECPVRDLITYNGDSLVSRARNELCLMFEKRPADEARFLMFIDSDIHFKPSDITRLRSHNLPVVAGLYFLKNLTCSPVLNTPIGKADGVLQRVREIGTGFLMIRRDTFGAIKAAGYAKQYRPGSNQHDLESKRTEYFPVGVKDDILLSEDYYFSHLCEMVNIPCYVDTTVMVGHKGWAMYPLYPDVLVRALVSALPRFAVDPKDRVPEALLAQLDEELKAYRAKYAPREEAPAAPVEKAWTTSTTLDRDALAKAVQHGAHDIDAVIYEPQAIPLNGAKS